MKWSNVSRFYRVYYVLCPDACHLSTAAAHQLLSTQFTHSLLALNSSCQIVVDPRVTSDEVMGDSGEVVWILFNS
jgi:hypothetical protein